VFTDLHSSGEYIMAQQIRRLIGVIALAATIDLFLLPHVNAQMNEQEFQVGRAREACINQAQKQILTFNKVISTTPIPGSGGRMIGSELMLNVSRAGSTYNVRCRYDNASKVATISSMQDSGGGTSGHSSAPPFIQGNFLGKGRASRSVFGLGQQTDASLNFNQTGKFSLSLAVPPGTGAQVNYNGTITHSRGTNSKNPNSFILDGKVNSFASSASNLRVIDTSGSCKIEVFDARVISTSCDTKVPVSSTRFTGMKQF
jgi:hypothetical protein